MQEKARVDRHNANLTRLDQLGAIDGSPDEISSALNEAGAFELTANACDEFLAEYAEKREFAVSALTERLARAEQLERERQELERLRLEEQQRQQERLAAAAARAAAEAARAEAEIKAQREKEAAFHRETQLRLEKEQAERRALEAEAAARERVAQEAAEAERRAAAAAADEKNRVRVHTEIVSRLCSAGLSATDAQIVVDVLIAGVPHVTINY
jgi:colicin import membrane protein